MTNLFFFYETITNNSRIEILDIISILTIISGICIIISKNPIISVLFLIGLFGGISTYLILIGLNFIGLSYIIIYIGAVSILFLFILMLINIRISELQNNNNNSLLLAILISIFFSFFTFQMLPYSIAVLNNFYININNIIYNLFFNQNKFLSLNTYKDNEIFFTSSNDWNGNLINTNHISNIGNIIYTNYNIWLIITSFILLLAMTGAIVITIKQK